MPSSIVILLSRIRLPAFAVGAGLVIADHFVDVLPASWLTWLAGLVVLAVLLRAGTLRREPVETRAPVTGRWLVYSGIGTRTIRAQPGGGQPRRP